MKQKRDSDHCISQARPVLSARSHRRAVRQEPVPQRTVAPYSKDRAFGASPTPATGVSMAAIARAVQTSPAYFSHALSRWSAMWGGSFYDLMAVAERFRLIPSLAVLEIRISQQLNLETDDGASGSLEGQ